MIGNQLRNSRFTIVSAAGIIFVFLLAGLVYNHLGTWDIPVRPSNTSPILEGSNTADLAGNVNNSEAFAYYFEHMYKPTITPSTVKYRPHNAFKWELMEDPKFPESMGEDLCIIDLDNRPFDKPHELFGPDIMSWTNNGDVHGLSLGVINHWIYAKIHGYKYYYVAIDDFGDRRASWKKPTIISEILKKHKTCIYIDSDAIFYRLELPFEWLMNYWRLDPKVHSLALAEDPNRDYNKDKFGKLYLNTGFIIAQNNKKTYEIMNAWDQCPNEGEPYPECTEFRKAPPGRPTDQGGFGTHVRYTYKDNIKTLPCMEANGFPLSDSECHGTFIRHLWTGKDDWIKVDVGAQTPGPYLEMFHKQYLAEKPNFYVTEQTLLGN